MPKTTEYKIMKHASNGDDTFHKGVPVGRIIGLEDCFRWLKKNGYSHLHHNGLFSMPVDNPEQDAYYYRIEEYEPLELLEI